MSLFHTILTDLTKKLRGVETYKEDIARSVSISIGIPVQASQLEITQGVLYIHVSPTIKSVILLKQKKILEVLKEYSITTIK